MEVLSSRVLLHPRDFDASLAFYCERLGLSVYREYGVDGRRTGVVLFCGGGFLELTSLPPRTGSEPDAALWLQVPDVATEHGRLVAAGVPVDQPPEPMPWGLIEMWTHDPDGRNIVLVEVPEGHPIRTRVS